MHCLHASRILHRTALPDLFFCVDCCLIEKPIRAEQVVFVVVVGFFWALFIGGLSKKHIPGLKKKQVGARTPNALRRKLLLFLFLPDHDACLDLDEWTVGPARRSGVGGNACIG